MQNNADYITRTCERLFQKSNAFLDITYHQPLPVTRNKERFMLIIMLSITNSV